VKELKPVLWPVKIIGYSTDFLSAKINSYYTKDTLVISGTPRGGTTWLMEILETLPGYKSIFEPLNKVWYPEVKRIGIPYDPYIPSEEEFQKLKIYFEEVFTGKVASFFPHIQYIYPKTILHRILAKNIVVKFVRANTILPWMASNFNLRAIYFIIRHPCATIASQIESGVYPKINKDIFLKEISKTPYIYENKDIVKKLEKIDSKIELLAAIWSFEQFIPLSLHKASWYTVVYEKLIMDWGKELEKIFDYINEAVPKKAYEKRRIPSIVTIDKSYIGTKKQLEKWKKKLSKRQIENILRVTRWFGMDFYDESIEPDYDALKHWESPF